MSETDRIRRIYDERAATYDRSLGLAERMVLGDLRREFGALLQGQSLEVGIGSGLNLPFYTAAVTHATGVDLSLGMLRQARRRAVALGLDVALAQANAEALPFPDASFDTVAISLALCTIPRPASALRELARVCRPHGRIVLLEHVLSPLRPVALALRALSPLQERAMGCHLDRETLDTARGLGFQIASERQRLFGVFRLVVARPPATDRATLDA
jgi:ubiquinone/menaquinone biosynthesis C-methylase UbiE